MNDNNGNLVYFNGLTKINLNPDRVLLSAVGELKTVTIIGETKDGAFYFASSLASGPSVLWDLEIAKKEIINICED